MVQGDLLAKFPQLPLLPLVFHMISLFNGGRIHKLAGFPLETNSLSGNDAFPSGPVHHAENVVVDDLFNSHRSPPHKKISQPLSHTIFLFTEKQEQSWSRPIGNIPTFDCVLILAFSLINVNSFYEKV